MSALLVNLFGGPGTGKSTTAGGLFLLLKLHGIKCELVLEFAKDLVREDRQLALQQQYYIWAKQLFRIERCINQVDVVITDSPILLSVLYDNGPIKSLSDAVWDSHNNFNNINILLNRVKPYVQDGRYQNELEANALDSDIKRILNDGNQSYNTYVGDETAINEITKIITDLSMIPLKYKITGEL